MDMMIRRKAMMGAVAAPTPPTPILPDAYQQTEYTQRPSGTAVTRAFNSTGITPNGVDDLEIQIGFLITGTISSTSGGYIICGGQNTNDNTVGFGIYVPQSATEIGCYGGESCLITPNGGSSVKDIRWDVVSRRIPSTGTIYISDGTNSNSVTTTLRNVARNFTLFGLSQYNSERINVPCFGRIYYCRIYEGGVLKVNLVPCRRKSDSRPGFYDTVNDVFRNSQYYSAGPDVN